MHSSQLHARNLVFPRNWTLCTSINAGSVLFIREREAIVELAPGNTELSFLRGFFLSLVGNRGGKAAGMRKGRGDGVVLKLTITPGKLQAGSLQLHLFSCSKNQSDSSLASAFILYFP